MASKEQLAEWRVAAGGFRDRAGKAASDELRRGYLDLANGYDKLIAAEDRSIKPTSS